jgi:hypothetical protein
LRQILTITRVIILATIIPTIGAAKINEKVIRIFSWFTTPKPALATAAPAIPPSKVCDELEVIPNHHVKRFQQIAAINQAHTTANVTDSGLTICATESATFKSKIKKASTLKNAAQSTAWKGDSTFVETTVAMELAAS